MAERAGTVSGGARRGGRVARVLAFVAAAVALWLLLRWLGARWLADAIPAFQAWVKGLGAWAPVAFIAGYAAAVVAFVPASALTLAAGATFGVVRGTAYTFVAASLGACAAFLVARHLARGAIEHRIAGDRRFAAIDRAIGQQGLRIVLLLRLSPIVSFTLLNYALGLSRVRFVDYAIGCAGMLPGTLAYVYSGTLAAAVATSAGGAAGGGASAARRALFAAGLVATLVATALVTRAARRALAEATGEEDREATAEEDRA